MVQDKHVIEALGKSRITIENGEITEITEPVIDYCPLFNKYRDIKKLDKDSIQENINYRINSFGMCTNKREIKQKDMLSVGISEILRSNTKIGFIDCVVGVCEGVGTLLMTDPEIIQGVGGRVSGLVETTAIPEVIEKVDPDKVLYPDSAKINQIEGLKEAIKRGYKNIAVTVLAGETIKQIRQIKKPSDVNIYILVAHTTHISMEDTVDAFENADIVTACASKNIREYAHKVKPYYYGTKVPIFATSENGHTLLDNRLKDIGKPLSINDYPMDSTDIPNPLK
ncbi:MAG: DUF2099 family protein [Methanosphaera sp.]|nr:DUF2099 family protein [Methanosphaera sp.]